MGGPEQKLLKSRVTDRRWWTISQRESIVRSDEAREANLMMLRSNSFDARFGRVPESRARLGSGDSGPSRERRSRGGLPPSTLAMASEAEEKARRVRSLLSSYYGSSGDAPFAPGARAVPAEPIDAPDFDAERYVRETLERTPLDALREKCASMREEARRLDGDAQTLVYENYSKFIAATDTVRDVRVNARAMEETMKEAKHLITATVEKAKQVDKNLSLRRDQVLALSGVRGLIAKLQNAFDVPEKMRAAINRDAPGVAANYYAAISPLLAKHGDRGAFVAVKKHAELEAKRARDVLFEAMSCAATRAAEAARARKDADPNSGLGKRPKEDPSDDKEKTFTATAKESAPTSVVRIGGQEEEEEEETLSKTPVSKRLNLSASECVRLLEKLGAQRRDARAAFVKAHASPMERALSHSESLLTRPGGRAQVNADPRAFVARLDGDFLEAFHRFAGEYLEVFGEDSSGDDKKTNDPSDRGTDRFALVDAARPLFVRYFDALKLALDASSAEVVGVPGDEHETEVDENDDFHAPAPLVPAKGLMAALATMAADLSSAHRLVPRLGLGDRAAEVVERAVRGRVGAAFFELETKLNRALEDLEREAARASRETFVGGESYEKGSSSRDAKAHQPLLTATSRVAAVFAGAVAEALDDARALLEERPVMVMGWRAEFEGLVRAKSQTFLQATLARLAAAAAKGPGGAPPPKALRAERDDASPLAASTQSKKRDEEERIFDPLFALTCASFAAFVRDEGVALVAAQLDRCFPPRQGSKSENLATEENLASSSLSAFKRRAQEACLFLVSSYARAKSDSIAAMLRRTTNSTDWSGMKEPRDVREIADATLQEIQKVDAEAAAFLSTAVQSEGKEKETVSSEETTVSRGRRYYVPSHATRSEVTASVVRFSLRAFAETLCVTNRFSRGGFRQVELDVAFLTPKLVAFGGSVSGKDAEFVDDLLKQCVAAAAARCLDPAPLDPAIVARILDAKQSRGGG